LSVIEQVRKTRRPVRLTRYGRPVAEIRPAAARQPRKSWIGAMAGTGEILGDMISPAFDEDEFDALRD
jgi:antitoxin (DNA-binding transcriptional repressor) of toxin-antitoxin stability system